MKRRNLKIAAAMFVATLAGTALCGFAPSQDGEIFVSSKDPISALEQIGAEYGLKDVRENFSLENCVDVAYGKVYRFAGTEKDVRLAVNENGKLLSVTLDEAATVDGNGAGALPSLTVNTKQTDFNGDTVDVGVDFTNGVYTLADPLRNIYVYNAHNGTGQFITDDQRYHNETGIFDEPIAITSYLNMIKVYDFYANGGVGKPFRGVDNSHDTIAGNEKENKESNIRLLIHYGVNEQNAHGWYEKYTNSAMVGVGDGREDSYFYKLGRAADVMAHEYQHAITHFTVDFVQMNESGAIDEAISDMLGALAEGYDLTDDRFWNMGEDAVGSNDLGVRSMKEPANGYKSSFNDLFPACHETHNHNMEGCDFGGVHYNSTILTHAQYKMWKALPDFYTKERIGELWFSVIPLLGKSATFEDFKSALVTTAENLDFTEQAVRVMQLSFLDADIVNTHIVHFCDEDGTPLAEVTVEDGKEAVYPGALPTKAADEQYEYTFERWSEDVTAVKEDMTVNAVYARTLRSYDVYFIGDGGRVLKTEKVAYGNAATPPDDPQKAGDAQFEYTFTGWDGDYLHITGETYLTAQFEQKVRSYSVRFLSEGDVFFESTMEYGSQITPPEPAPHREGFTFGGWYLDAQFMKKADPFPTVTKNTDFYAKWEEITHTVHFCDEDGTPLAEVTVKDGKEAVYPGTLPTKAADEQYEYTFERWSGDVTAVKEDMTVNAVYARTLRSYDVYFLDENGQVLKTEKVAYGNAATPPDDPQKAGDAQFEYTFTGWDGNYGNITGETYLTAQFQQKVRSYTVRFLSDGETYSESTLEYGTQISAPSPAPEKEGYLFEGWYLDPQLTQSAETFPTVTGNAEFYAKWTKAEEPTDPQEPEDPEDPEDPTKPTPQEPQDPEDPTSPEAKEGCGAGLAFSPFAALLLFPLLLKKRRH